MGTPVMGGMEMEPDVSQANLGYTAFQSAAHRESFDETQHHKHTAADQLLELSANQSIDY